MERKTFFFVSFLLCVFLSGSVSAQLINYGRKNRFIGSDVSGKKDEKIPSWAEKLPEPGNAEERRYDINRDGKLQSAEVKVYLRDIIARVESNGYVEVTTDLLREYDKNKDGMINTSEIKVMKEQVE